MATFGLLLLFLSSTLLVCSLSQPLDHSAADQPKDQHYRLQKRVSKKTVVTAVDYTIKIGKLVTPFIGLIPGVGQYTKPAIDAVLGVGALVVDALKPNPTQTLLNELRKVETQFNQYYGMVKWDIWASHYSVYETDINVGWKELQNLLDILNNENSDKSGREAHIKKFKKDLQSISLSTSKLHDSLTAKNTYFSPEFAKLIKENIKCHEKEITELTVFVSLIIFKGNTVNYFYSSLLGVDVIDSATEIAFDCAKAIFEIHKDCISNSLQYVREDVKDLIVKSEISKRKQLAKNIRSFLDSTYNRYNWMVVVFITKNSKENSLDISNKHIVSSGFIEVPHGEITAAIARQVKGNHTDKADKVRKAIDTCFREKLPDCHKVQSELDKCKDSDGFDLNRYYTAIHAYIDKSHDSYMALDAKEAPEEYIGSDTPSYIPYVYNGKCKKYKTFKTGRFRVLIKSDEEILGKSPCEKLQCNKGKGQCELLDNNNTPVCKCEEGFYGENCEESIEDYKERLRGAIEYTNI